MTQASTPDPLTLRDRLLAATYRCVVRFGLGKTTVEDIVKESGVSRATIYRQFPGGRDELLLETTGWELANYFNALADHVRDAPDLAQLLEQGLAHAHQSLAEHAVLRKILETEPERLLPLLTVESARTLPFIADFLHPYLVRESDAGRLRAGVDLDDAAEYLARCILSLINASGRWNLADPSQVRELVRDELLGGIVRVNGPDGPDEPDRPEPPGEGPQRREPFLFQLIRTAIAPPVLDDGGHDAPLSPRGRILFWGTVGVLVAGIAVLLVLTLAK